MRDLESIQIYSRPGEITIFFNNRLYAWTDEDKKKVTLNIGAAIFSGELTWGDAENIDHGCIVCHYNPTIITEKDAQKGVKRIVDAIKSTEIPTTPEPEILELQLSLRSTNCLLIAGIRDFEDLTNRTAEDLRKLRNMGPKQVQEVIDAMNKRGLSLRKEETEEEKPDEEKTDEEKPDEEKHK